MSRILCIVLSLPDRRLAADFGVTTGTASSMAGVRSLVMRNPTWTTTPMATSRRKRRRGLPAQLVPIMLAPWAPKLIDLAEVRPGAHVLDVARGTGVVTRLAR